jgi:hypothetical protein
MILSWQIAQLLHEGTSFQSFAAILPAGVPVVMTILSFLAGNVIPSGRRETAQDFEMLSLMSRLEMFEDSSELHMSTGGLGYYAARPST